MQAIEAENVTRRYQNGRGIDHVSLRLAGGRCLAILGDNGSGKTTLIRLLAGIDRPDSGRLTVLGQAPSGRSAQLRRQCGVALDAAGHWDSLSGRQNLWFFARGYGMAGEHLDRHVSGLLDEAGLLCQADEPVGTYSFGMRRKLAILQALCHDPEMLIMDEPCAGVDASFLEYLGQLTHRRGEQGKTTCIADNNADWLAKAATDAVLLDSGRLCAQAVVAEALKSVRPSCRIDIALEAPDRSGPPHFEGLWRYESRGNHVIVEADGNGALPAKLLDWIARHNGKVRSMNVASITLLDALRRQVSRKGQP